VEQEAIMRFTSALHNARDDCKVHRREGRAVVTAGLLAATPVAGGVGVEILGLDASHLPVSTVLQQPVPQAPADNGSGLVEYQEVTNGFLRNQAHGLPDLYVSAGKVYSSDGVPVL